MTDLSSLGMKIGVTSPRVLRLSGVASQPSDAKIRFEGEDLGDEFNHVKSSVVSEEDEALSFEFPEGFKFNKIRETLKINKEVTDSHRRMNEIVSRLDEDKLKLFTKKILLNLGTIAKNQLDEGDLDTQSHCIPEKKLVAFYTDVHRYNTSPEYRIQCTEMFEGEEECLGEHMIVAYRIVEFVRIFCLKQKVKQLKIGNFEGNSDSDDAEITLTRMLREGKCTSPIGKGKKMTDKGRRKGRGPSKGKRKPTSQQTDENDNVVCEKCRTHDKEDTWIECDSCDGWYHRGCAGLRNHHKWKKYENDEAKFLCKDCV